MTTIAVVGVGAVGGVIASALLAGTGHRLLLCARRGFERLCIDGPGGRVERPVAVHTDPGADDLDRGVAWLLLATKAHQTRDAAGWLSRLCDAATTVAVLQNGVEHVDRVTPLAGHARVVPVIVDCPATRTVPGRITCHRAPRLVAPDTPDGRRLAALLASAGLAADVAADFISAAWRKLCVNVVSGAIPALCDQPRGVFRRPGIAALTRGLIDECVRVGRAEGAVLDDDLPDRILATMQAGPADALTSMLVDRRAGVPLEADARNGAVVRAGERHGIPTPLNRAVNALLSAVNT